MNEIKVFCDNCGGCKKKHSTESPLCKKYNPAPNECDPGLQLTGDDPSEEYSLQALEVIKSFRRF